MVDDQPGQAPFLFGTGTGLAPFMSIIKDPDVYGRFDKVILVGKPLLRAYSIASANYEENLEFLSIKVQNATPSWSAASPSARWWSTTSSPASTCSCSAPAPAWRPS